MKKIFLSFLLTNALLQISLYTSTVNATMITISEDQQLEVHFQTLPTDDIFDFDTYDFLNLSLPEVLYSDQPSFPILSASLSINGSITKTNFTPFIYNAGKGQSISFDWISSSSLFANLAPPVIDFQPLIEEKANGVFTISILKGAITINTDLVNMGLGIGTGPYGATYNQNSASITGFVITTVPEPSTLAILTLSLIGIGARRFKKHL
jgi:hypothetical protein